MADAAVAEEIRKRRAADALLNGDDSEDPDPEPTEENLPTPDDTGEQPPPDQAAEEEIPPAAEEKAPNLGYRFVPVTAPAQSVFQGMGEEGADVSPALTSAPVYSTAEEQGNQQYVIDQATGAKIPRAQLATGEDLAAQPPPQGAVQFPQEVVTGQAPDQLTQVERAEPVEAPGKLAQVERGELIPSPPAVKPALPAAPSTAFLGEEGVAVTPTAPAVKRALPVTTEPISVPTAEYTDRVQKWRAAMQAYGFDAKVKPDGTWVGVDSSGKEVTPEQNKGLYQFGARLSQQYGFSGQEQKLGQLGDAVPTAPAVKRAEAIGAPPKVQPAQPITTNPDGSDLPQRVQAVGNNDPAAFIVHHTSGRGTVDGVVSTLKERGLGVQYVMDRDGNIFQTGGPGAQNILKGWGKGEGLSNQNIVGMEIIAKDDKDVTDAQKQSFARFIAARYPTTPLYGHGEVNPGHKEADEGLSAKTAALAYRDQLSSGQVAQAPGTAPQAQPVTKQANGLYQNEKPSEFLSGKATTFATPEDLASGQDNGVGAPRLGKLDTTAVAGVAIPEEALRAKYGNNYAAWRRARVDVVDPQTGKRLRVPIVDLGPRGDQEAIADMTPTLSSYFGGDKNLMVKLVDNAGPDVTKNPQLFADEQAAIRQGFDSSTLQPGVQKIAPKLGYTFKPVDSAQNAALQQADTANQAKQTATLQALPEAKGDNVIALYNRLEQPVEGVNDAMRQSFQKQVKAEITKQAQAQYGIKDPDEAFQRATQAPNVLDYGSQLLKDAGGHMLSMVSGFNANMAARDEDSVRKMLALVNPNASPEQISVTMKALTNPDLSHQDREKLIRDSVMVPYSQLDEAHQGTFDLAGSVEALRRLSDPKYVAERDRVVKAQVDAVDKLLKPDPRLNPIAAHVIDVVGQLPAIGIQMATGPIGGSLMLSDIYKGTLDKLKAEHPEMSDAQRQDMAGRNALVQAGIMYASGGMGKLFDGFLGDIQNTFARGAAKVGTHAGAGSATMVAAKAAENLLTGDPLGTGLGEAAITGGGLGVMGALGRTESAVRPPVSEEAPPQPEPPTTQPVTRASILGPNVPDISMPWYKPGPIVTRAAERTGFSPQELAGKVEELRQAGWTPSQIQQAMENLQPEPDFLRQTVHLGAEAQADLRATPVTQEDVARRTYELGQERAISGQPGTAADDYAQAQKELSRTSEPILPATVSEAEPINSAIANRYVQERMAAGELGEIDPSQGKSTEDMVQQGLKMSPTQRDGLIDNFMKGKGGDIDQQGAAIRSKEALLSEQARAASRAADADPTNPQLQAQAKAASDAVTAFHNGPIKKFKKDWSNAGRGLQREIPLDYTTLNGMKEAYLKGNNKEPPAFLEPKLKRMAEVVSKTADAERGAMNNLGKEIENRTRGKTLPADDQIRARLMEIMKNLPCPT